MHAALPARLAFRLLVGATCIAASAAALAQEVPPPRRFAAGATASAYVERSAPGLHGTTFDAGLVFAVRLSRSLSLRVEGGRARFRGNGQEGHRDFHLGGLLGAHFSRAPGGLALLVGAAVVHSERHKFFADLRANQAALVVGAEYGRAIGNDLTIAATWRSYLSAGLYVHRPGVSVRLRF